MMIIIDACATLKVALLHINRLNRSLLLHTVLLHFRDRCVIPTCLSINFILIGGRIKAVFEAWVKTSLLHFLGIYLAYCHSQDLFLYCNVPTVVSILLNVLLSANRIKHTHYIVCEC